MATKTAEAPTQEELQAALELVLDNSIELTNAAAQRGLSYTTFSRQVRTGRIAGFKIGRDVRVWLPSINGLW